ncbi:MAG TPA: M48 family metallopeptidase [Terriglobales bacterium]|nr:M48 family metallopeptidase [Terriglobales bacterium]
MTTFQALRCVTVLVLTALLAVPAWAVTPTTPELPPPGNPSMSREDQQKLGRQAAAEVYKQMPVLPDSDPITQYVQRLGARLVKQIPPDASWPYEFHVVQQKEINAFALPGGPIFINLGTITAAADEGQLAGVISHEMSHIYMQHTAKSIPRQQAQGIIGALGSVLGGIIGGTAGTIARIGAAGTGVFLLKYSRADEAEADSVGAIIMYKAGYNPIELANFFEMLSKQGGTPPQFLSDHPNPGNRTEAIQKEIQDWPPKNYRRDSPEFVNAKEKASGVRAYNSQEIADGAKQGLWAQHNIKNGSVPADVRASVQQAAGQRAIANVTFDQVRPSDQFSDLHQMGVSISYPSNWSTATGQDSITIAPKAGVSQNAIAYGVIVSAVQDANAGSLDQAAQDLIQNLERSNPGLRQSGDIRGETAGGREGRSVDLTGSSPLQQGANPLPERDWLVVTQGSDRSYLYLIFIAPEKDFAALRPTYHRMLDSLRME